MGIFKKAFVLFFIIGMTVISSACQKIDNDKLNKDQKKILNAYVSEHLLQEHQYLYYKSEASLSPLNPPLTPEDFKLPEIALLPGRQQKIDTLFTKKELESWSKQLKIYKRIIWNKSLFPGSVEFIKEEEIPNYLSHTDIPPPGQDPVFIHYLSIPFIHPGERRTALLYSKKWSSGANIEVRYHYFKKREKKWKMIKEGPLNTGY